MSCSISTTPILTVALLHINKLYYLIKNTGSVSLQFLLSVKLHMDLIKKSNELFIANKELAFQNEEKEKRAAELFIANRELAFQNEEKEKLAAELIVANKELAFQNHEKEKRANELIVANTELLFQNEEKEKRAAELVIANKELAFQNEEKEKRAAELIVANKELSYQNKEKEKRAAELIIANKELAYENKEKERRAAELIVANKELVFQNIQNEKRGKEMEEANRDLVIVENQLKLVNKELEAFSYSVSHDLRAPLRAISGYSNMLKEDYSAKLDVEANRIIDVIVDKTHMMGQLIDDLLTFSKMARLEVVSESINIKNIIQKCIDEIIQADKNEKVSITIENLPHCNGDAAMLKQVWYNLICNAVKYTSKKEKPEIIIGATEDEEKIIYFIKDNGAGFDMKYSKNLFGVFQRLHRQDEFEGTGLGLALAKRIINKHAGDIWATSLLNEGTTFYFSLPKKTQL